MTLAFHDRWVWDFWFAHSGEEYHVYYLSAPKDLEDEGLRHRNATIGHSVSTDLVNWSELGAVLAPGRPGAYDANATWTGSVVEDPDGLWHMFYTGARFLGGDSAANIQTIGMATSADLHTWVKDTRPILGADPRWYETLGDQTWHEEAWRDPWVFFDAESERWHMLLTGRARGEGDDRGVIAHAVSADLHHWEAREPVSGPGAGFEHLEVPQLASVSGRDVLLFSCDTAHLAGHHLANGEGGGIWALPTGKATATHDTASAVRLTGDEFYSGRIIADPHGLPVLLAFRNRGPSGEFVGELSNPMPLVWSSDGVLTVVSEAHR